MRIIKAYNTAQFHLNMTGAGMVGLEYSNFEEEIINKHCIYYNELKPILADRPNITPWATNFDTSDSDSDDNGNKSIESESESLNTSVICILDETDDELCESITVKRNSSMSTQGVS
jgi:hypothetical protein